MIEAQIADGNYVVIKKQETCRDGQIAAMLIDGAAEEEATLKRYYK